MIKINLLPKKPKRAIAKYDLYLCILVTLVNVAILGGFYFTNVTHISSYRNMIASTQKEKAALEPVFGEFMRLEKEKKEIETRIRGIGALKEGRALAARTLFDLTSVVRESLWLKTLKKSQNTFELEGRSLENESISSFIESLSNIPYMTNVELKNIEDVSEEGIVIKKFVIQGNIGL